MGFKYLCMYTTTTLAFFIGGEDRDKQTLLENRCTKAQSLFILWGDLEISLLARFVYIKRND